MSQSTPPIALSGLPPAPPLFRIEQERGANASDVQVLRDKALALIKLNQLDAALPLFEAVAALHPNDAQYFSDLGVTWMRMGEWAQAWGAFGRALSLDPAHALALENSGDLRKFLGDDHPVVVANSLQPARRQPRAREHAVSPLPKLTKLPPIDHELQWWRGPVILAAPSSSSTSTAAAVSPDGTTTAAAPLPPLEHTLGTHLAHRSARHYPGGRPHPEKLSFTRPVLWSLRALKSPAGRAGRAVAWIPLDKQSEFDTTLEKLRLSAPPFATRHPMEIVPDGECLSSLESSGQLAAFERLIYRRGLLLSSSPGSTQHLKRDPIGTANWELQIRGSKRWLLCPGGQTAPATQCAMNTSTSAALIDVFDPNYTLCPGFKNASCFEATIGEGQAIHYPPPWWVQSQALTHGAASITGSLITREGAGTVTSRLKEACTAVFANIESFSNNDGVAVIKPERIHEVINGTLFQEDEVSVAATEAAGLCNALTPCMESWEKVQPMPAADGAAQRRALVDWLNKTQKAKDVSARDVNL